jgi:hypothetical protein
LKEQHNNFVYEFHCRPITSACEVNPGKPVLREVMRCGRDTPHMSVPDSVAQERDPTTL